MLPTEENETLLFNDQLQLTKTKRSSEIQKLNQMLTRKSNTHWAITSFANLFSCSCAENINSIIHSAKECRASSWRKDIDWWIASNRHKRVIDRLTLSHLSKLGIRQWPPLILNKDSVLCVKSLQFHGTGTATINGTSSNPRVRMVFGLSAALLQISDGDQGNR